MFFFPSLDNTITQKNRFSNDSWPFQALSSAAQASNFGMSPMDKLCTRCASVFSRADVAASWTGFRWAKASLETMVFGDLWTFQGNHESTDGEQTLGGCPFLVGSIHIFVGCTNSAPSIWWIDCMSSCFFALFRTKQVPPYPFWTETLVHVVASLDGNSCSQIFRPHDLPTSLGLA